MSLLSSHWRRVEYLPKLFGIFPYRMFVYSSFCIFFNHLFNSLWTHGHLIYTRGYNSMLFYFVNQIVPALFIGSSFIWLLCPFDISHHCVLLLLSTFLLFGTTRCPGFILYIFCPSSRISHLYKELWLHLLEGGIRNQDLGVRCACKY